MLALAFNLNLNDKLSAIAQFAIVLGIMVIVHELGHFIAAKACGVRVEAFAVGFGKRLFGFVHNGTDYRLNLFPVGGYVKMAGMELTGDQITDDPGEFQNHPRWQRTIIALAGPVFNFILAFVLLTGLYMRHHEVPSFESDAPTADYIVSGSQVAKTGMQIGDKVVRIDNVENPSYTDVFLRGKLNLNRTIPFSYLHDGRRVDSSLFIANKGSDDDFNPLKLGLIPVEQQVPLAVDDVSDTTTPAARAGLKKDDRILAIDAIHPHSVDTLLAYLQDNGGKPVDLTVQRPGVPQPLHLLVTPYAADTKNNKDFHLGFKNQPAPVQVDRLSFADAATLSYRNNLKNSRLILDVLHRLFTRQVSVKSLSSPIGMGVEVHQAFQIPGPNPIFEVMAMISLNLGIFNLLPIPILDGGMILFLAIESLMRRDVSIQIKERVFQVAFVCIVLFAAVVIFNDITKYLPTHLKT